MAIFTPSGLVGAVSGKVGGVTFVTSGRGQVIKSAAVKVRAFTRLQLERQAHMAWMQGKWAALTVEQKAAWSAKALEVVRHNALGQVTTMSGYQAFIKAHGYLFWQPSSVYTTPTLKLVGRMVICSAVFDVSAATYGVTVTGPGLSGEQRTLLWGATEGQRRVKKRLKNWRYLGRLTGNYGSSYNQYALWLAGFGSAMVAGQAFGLRVVNLKDCYWSEATEYYGVVQA